MVSTIEAKLQGDLPVQRGRCSACVRIGLVATMVLVSGCTCVAQPSASKACSHVDTRRRAEMKPEIWYAGVRVFDWR